MITGDAISHIFQFDDCTGAVSAPVSASIAHLNVNGTDIIANLVKNAENACRVVAQAVAEMPKTRDCKCGSALAHAILTDRAAVPAATKQKLGILIDKYFV
jgi:5'-methylthioadenosine phosphorylase